MPLHPKQLNYLRAALNSDRRLHLSIGVRRSGKTHAAAAGLLYHARAYPPDTQFLLGARTTGTCRDGVAAAVKDIAHEWGMAVKEYAGAGRRLVIDGREFKMLGFADSVGHVTLQGTTIGGAVLDEIQNLPENAFQQIVACASLPGAKIIMTGNPLGTTHWVKQNLWDKADEVGVQVYSWGRDDNPTVGSDYYERLGVQLTGAMRARWYEGEWADEGGLVYPYWTVTAEMPPAFGQAYVGVDYGDAGVTAAVRVCQLPGNDGYLATDCYEWDNKSMRPTREATDHAAALIRQFGGRGLWYSDPANPVLRRALLAKGVQATGAFNELSPGISMTNELLKRGRLVIYAPACQPLIDRLGGLVWNEREKPEGNDHLPDALRYAAYPCWRRDVGLGMSSDVWG